MHKLIRKISIWYFKRSGWIFSGEIPDFEPKTVIIANRFSGKKDFVFALAVLTLTHFRCSMLVDKRYFNFLIKKVLHRLSCRPYDFRNPLAERERLITIYSSRKKQSMVFVTRKKSEDPTVFRDDFYFVAQRIKVPIIMVSFDKLKRIVKIHTAFLPSDDK
ncbi:MAG: hypothetical protein ACKVOK_05615, partial [Flavobacteriales bacterium]